jgi:aspartyl aminopeptidase
VSVYSSLSAFLNAKSKHDVMPLFVAFDNEEVGSLTKQGADSTFLEATIERISKALEIDEDEKHKILSRSFALSVDNAHANHPNHPEFSDQTTDVRLGEGVVIKYNANQSYTSDAKSVACLTSIAKSSDIKLQNFTNKNDLRGGSTLGNISNSHLSLNTVDIGIPQLAMHSSLEICAAKDIVSLIELIEAFYTSYDQSLIA